MPSNGMSDYAKRWHMLRREQRKLEEPFIVHLLEGANPETVSEILRGLNSEAIAAISFHLQNTRMDYWAEIRYHNVEYAFEAHSPEAIAREKRFEATIKTILSTLNNAG